MGQLMMGASIIYIWYCFNMSQLTIGGGLDNLGNTCFFNATLQSILHTRPLATILAKHQHSHSCRLKNQRLWCCFCEMEVVFTATRQAKRFAPNSMINNLKSIFKKVFVYLCSSNSAAKKIPMNFSDIWWRACSRQRQGS